MKNEIAEKEEADLRFYYTQLKTVEGTLRMTIPKHFVPIFGLKTGDYVRVHIEKVNPPIAIPSETSIPK